MASTDIGNLIRRYAHLTDEEIEAYVDKTLDLKSLEMVERHLRHCSYCRKEVEILREAFSEPDLDDDPNLSDDLARQKVIRILDKIRPQYTRIWLGDKSFPLEPSEEHPGFFGIGGDLVLAELEDAIEKDRETQGGFALKMEGGGLDPILAFLKDLRDVNDIDLEEFRLLAGTKRTESHTPQEKQVELEPVFICNLSDVTLEVFSQEPSTALFLRLT